MKLFVATPMFGAQCAGIYADAMCRLYDLCIHSGIALQHRFIYNGSVISRLRTDLANEFMASDATHLLFVDADIGFDPRDAVELVNVQRSRSFAIVGGAYLKKNIHWDKVAASVPVLKKASDLNYCTGDYTVKLASGADFDRTCMNPVEAEFLGAGFMLIPRSTFDLFKKSFPTYAYSNGSKMLYFADEIQDDKHVSEDVFFCKMVRKAGGKIGCCPWMKISHFGNHVYGGPPTQFL